MPRKDDLIHEIAGLILSDSRIAPHPWDALAVVATLTDGASSLNGCRYFGADFEPATPRSNARAIHDRMAELQVLMAAESGSRWHQCLMQISPPVRRLLQLRSPAPRVSVQFEHDDPKRWSLREASPEGARAFYLSIRPVAN